MSEAPFNLVTIFLIIQTIALVATLFMFMKTRRHAVQSNQERERTISMLLDQNAEKIRLHREEQDRNRRAGDRLYIPRPMISRDAIRPAKPVGTEPSSSVSNVVQDTSSYSSGCADSGSSSSSSSGGNCD